MNKFFTWFAGGIMLFSGISAQADPIRDNSLNSHQAGWCPNNYDGNGLRSCEDTCQAIGAIPEHEARGIQNQGETPVCKVSVPSWSWPQELYGSQTYVNGYPVCYFADQNGGTQFSPSFQCLCVKVSTASCADLIVEKLVSVTWHPASNKTRVVATIKNIGGALAWPSTASLTDWGGLNSPTPVMPYVTTTSTPYVSAGERRNVTFILPYKIRVPNARGVIAVDHNNVINECRERNNTNWIWL